METIYLKIPHWLSGSSLLKVCQSTMPGLYARKVGNGELKYTPEQVQEYGFRNGKVYISRQITLEGEPTQVFFAKVVKRKNQPVLFPGKGYEDFFPGKK